MLTSAQSVLAFLLILQNGDTANIESYFPELNSLDAPILGTDGSDADLNFTQIAAKYGHPAEEYRAYTEDGYRLKVFRLPGWRRALPILLFHGILDSSDTWIIRGNGSLAITLANAGYDVWLGNARGNKYSQGHLTLPLDTNSTYWNFTFHEHGVYDLATTIDLVLEETGADRLNTVGHSQGTTIHFVLLSTRPEYNDKVNLFIALAPVAYLHHSPPPLSVVLRLLPAVERTFRKVHKYEVFGDISPEYAFIRDVCNNPVSAYTVCLTGIVYPLAGYDLTEVDPAFSLVAFRHFPTASSTKNLRHFGQLFIRKSFARFDYGRAGNLVAYGSAEPPHYELDKVRSKTVLMTALNDYLSTQQDVALLRRQLGNVVRFMIVPRAKMNHLDYVWGEHMATYLFPYIFDSLNRYGEA